MTQQIINVGSAPNDGTGDDLRTTGGKINDNFTEVYADAATANAVAVAAATDATTALASSRERLNAPRDYFVRRSLGAVTVTIASPCVATCTTHGLAVDNQVTFFSPRLRATVTMTSANPGVMTRVAHGYVVDDPVRFLSGGVLPTNIVAGTTYYVKTTPTVDSFTVSATPGGTAIDTTAGTQSGVHWVERAGFLPTGITQGVTYWVVAVPDANTFRFSITQGGAAVNTSGTQGGYFTLQTGSDSNDGLTTLTPFMSVMKAHNTIFESLDLNNFSPTVNIADGLYNERFVFGAPTNGKAVSTENVAPDDPDIPQGVVNIFGNSSDPSAVIFDCLPNTSGHNDTGVWVDGPGAFYRITDIYIKYPNDVGLFVSNNAIVLLHKQFGVGSVYFECGPTPAGGGPTIWAGFGGELYCYGSKYSFKGSNHYLMVSSNGKGASLSYVPGTTEFVGTPNYDAVAAAQTDTSLDFDLGTVVGAYTLGANPHLTFYGHKWGVDTFGRLSTPYYSGFGGGLTEGTPGHIKPFAIFNNVDYSYFGVPGVDGNILFNTGGTNTPPFHLLGDGGSCGYMATSASFKWISGLGIAPSGTATTTFSSASGSGTSALQIESAGGFNFVLGRVGASAASPSIITAKTRGAAIASHTAVQTNDFIGGWQMFGSDGSDYIESAFWGARVNGTVSAGVVPSDYEFFTGTPFVSRRLRIKSDGQVNINDQVAVPAGGAQTSGLTFSSTANLGVFWGSGVPTLSAAKGSLYMRTDGTTTNDRMYVNTNGSTGWTAVTTAA